MKEQFREELIAYDKWLTRRKWGTGEIISPEKAADLYLAEHPIPPAEGAEEIRVEYSEESLGFFRSFIRARKELCAISPTETYSLEEAIRKAFDGFATLHAQKIADKMVEERIILDEEMAEPVQDALYATGRFTIDECNVLTEGILMYIKERGIINLKSRENDSKS